MTTPSANSTQQRMLHIMHTTHAALAEEVQEFQQLCGGHLFMLGGRGWALDREKLRWRSQVESKLANGTYHFEHKPCLCGSEQDELLAVRDMFGFHFKTVICRHCGMVRADPYFDDVSLQQFYTLEYDPLYRPEFAENPPGFFKGKAAFKLPNVYQPLAQHCPPPSRQKRI